MKAQQQIEKLRSLQESFDNLASSLEKLSNSSSAIALDKEVAEGKKQISDAINTKGGNSTGNESFQELAQDIVNLNDTFITYGVTTNGEKIDWLKFVTSTTAETRSFIKEINNDEITYIDKMQCFENCINLTKIRFSNLTRMYSSASSAFSNCTLLSEIECDNLLYINAQAAFSSCSSLKELNLPNLISITGTNAFNKCPLKNINIPKCVTLSINGIFPTTTSLRNVIVGTLTSLHVNTFGVAANRMNALRNFTIGVNTDIDLPLYQWTATTVIAEGQSGIDELNNNLYNNLLTKLYDHSTDGQTRTLRLGWLAKVSQENIDYANSKGWTLTT